MPLAYSRHRRSLALNLADPTYKLLSQHTNNITHPLGVQKPSSDASAKGKARGRDEQEARGLTALVIQLSRFITKHIVHLAKVCVCVRACVRVCVCA